jgi:SNF2 family DNA or RNA helicase
VQAIAAAELMARHLGVRRVLVVCPVSLKHQWQREFERFSGRRAHVVQGLRPERQRHWREEAFAHIVNYEVLARDLDLIHALDPELLIVDEAQRVKNWNTVAARALRRIDAPYALVLTGTPLENRLEELIAIVQLVDQHRLGPTWRLLHEHQLRDDSGRVVGYAGLDRLAATLAPVMLRRRKSEVLSQLPERIDNTLLLPMTPQQRVHHDENGAIVSRIVKRWRATGFLSDSDQLRLTCALQSMRMACNSTWLLDRETDHGTKADELMTLLEELLADPAAKAVVFSQWVRTHEILVPRLERRGIGHVLFHGGVPGERRGALVDRFNQDADCRVFLSTDAGGVGLNLQHAAAVVVNMDQPWNPAVLEQRIGRVHRMGQKRSVQVVNLVAQGSIEESMLGLLAFKKSLFAGVLDGGAGEVTLQGSRLARFMKAVDEATRGVPAAEADIGADVDVDAKEAVAEPPVHAAALPPQPVELGAVAPEGDAVEACAPAPVAAGTAGAPGVPTAAPGSAPDAWRPLLDAGLALLAQLAAAAEAPPGAASPWVQSDPAGGARFLRLPLPEPGTLRRVADALAALADRLPAAARPEDPA